MNEHLFDKKKFKKTNIPNGMAPDLDEECAAYEELLVKHPLDIQLLGLGKMAISRSMNPELLSIRLRMLHN